ncbi:MAG: tRNA guanosine(34) transglycosylase Tgt [Bacteriovoracaceae bacterium]|nr:tRNA guanosine(34) transglycosylase Tgt [Bacteriovoracaceae bacterium]
MSITNDVKENFKFKLIHVDKNCGARAGEIITPHGVIKTPVFMPVGTHGAMKALQPSVLKDMDIEILLSNTYHLHLTPGSELIKKAGGLHKYMAWDRPILTDSGGFQVFSLHKKRSITEEGAEFPDKDGKKIMLTPEKSIEIQQNLGSDIMMAFDECIPHPAEMDYVTKSCERTHRWLDRCINAWTNPKQALFGIIQGSVYDESRLKCIEEVCSRDLPGYAIGGVSVGEGPELMEKIVSFTAPKMPKDKPRYVMGVGTPEDLFMIWENGVDMSDCIIPTKYGRGGTLYTNRGKLRIKHKNYRRDFFPIEPNCNCYVCQNFTRSYVKHLFDSNEILGQILATNHNIAFYKNLAEKAREAILEDRFLEFKKEFLTGYRKGN